MIGGTTVRIEANRACTSDGCWFFAASVLEPLVFAVVAVGNVLVTVNSKFFAR